MPISPLRSPSRASFRSCREPRFVSVFEILHCLNSSMRPEIALAVVSGSRGVSALAALPGQDVAMYAYRVDGCRTKSL